MSTLAELLDAILDEAWRRAHTPDVADVAGALGQLAKLVPVEASPNERYGPERERAATALATACRLTAATHAVQSGRLTDLAGAAAEQAAVLGVPRSSGAQWALVEGALPAVLACAAVLREHAPNSEAAALSPAVTEVERQLRVRPVTPADASWLDQSLPDPHSQPSSSLERISVALESVCAAARSPHFTPYHARWIAAAGLHASMFTQAIARGLSDVGEPIADDATTSTVVKAWFDVRDTVRQADRALRIPGRDASVGHACTEVITALTDALGPVDRPAVHKAGMNTAELATLCRSMTNRLPEIATSLAVVSARCMNRPKTIEHEEPIAFPVRTGITGFAGIRSNRLDPDLGLRTIAAATGAADVSMSLAAHLDGTAVRVGVQPHHRLAAAHLAASAAQLPGGSIQWARLVEGFLPATTHGPDWPGLAMTLDRSANAVSHACDVAGVDEAPKPIRSHPIRKRPAQHPEQRQRQSGPTR